MRSTIVTENDATLKIDLTKKAKRRVRFFLFFNPVVYFVVIVWLITLLKKNIPILHVVLCAIFFLFLSFSFFYSLFKSYKGFRGVVLKKVNDHIYLNDRRVCSMSEVGNIIVQPKYDFSEVPSLTASIGILIGKKSLPISYGHNPQFAIEIANIMGVFFSCDVIEKKVIQISLITKW